MGGVMILSTLSENLQARSRDALILLCSSSPKGGFPGEGIITLNLAIDVIQEDIGGHPPIPLGPPPLFISVFQFP